MHYDRIRPPAAAMVHCGSTHPIHGNLRKTLNLLAIDAKSGPIYFVFEGLGTWPVTHEELQINQRFFYEEYTCPTNFTRAALIVHDGDSDPHGVFRFVESIWMTCEYEAIKDSVVDCGELTEYLQEAFPQLKLDPGPSEAELENQNASVS